MAEFKEKEDYFYYDHPVIGRVGLRKDVAQRYADDPAALNKALIEGYAKKMEAEGEDLSSFLTFTGHAAREITSTSRGLQERAGADRTTSYNDDFVAELAMEMNPTAAWTGLITGALLDPVTFLNPLAKASKVKSILGGAAAGGAAGFFTPIREEFGESSAITTGAGATLGGILAAVSPALATLAPRIAKKMGYNSEKELQEAIQAAPAEEKIVLQKEVESYVQEEVAAVQRMGERQREANAAKAAQEAELERIRNIDMRTEVTNPDKLADIERIRQIGKDADVANIRKIGDDAVAARDADIKARINELRKEVGDLPTGTQQKAIESSVKENKAYIKSLETKANNIEKAINGIKKNKKIPPKKKREQTLPLQKELERLRAEAAQRAQQNKDTYEPLADRLKELRRAQQELRVYDKTGEVPPSLKINKPVQRTAEEVKDMGLQDIPESMKAPVEEPPLTAIPEAVQQASPQRSVERIRLEQARAQQAAEQGQPRLSDTPEGRAVEAQKAAQEADSTLQVDSLNPHKSASSAARKSVSDAELRDTANLDFRTKEARKLEGETRFEKQKAKLDEATAHEKPYYQADEIDGRITWDKVGREAEWLEDMVSDDINQGNYRNAADWLMETLRKQNNQLSAAQWRVADKIFKIAENNLEVALINIKKLEANDGQFTAKMTAELNGIQTDQALLDLARSMQALRQGEAGAKASWSAAGRELNRIKKLTQAQNAEYRKNRVIKSIILGTRCK